MIAIWIVAVGIAAFGLGLAIGGWNVVRQFKRDLKDRKGPIAKMFEATLDSVDKSLTETCAQGAELYQDRYFCPNKCGQEIAKMLREKFSE